MGVDVDETGSNITPAYIDNLFTRQGIRRSNFGNPPILNGQVAPKPGIAAAIDDFGIG